MDINDVVINIIASIVVALLSAILTGIIIFIKNSKKNFYDALASSLGMKSKKGSMLWRDYMNRHHFYHYVKHEFTLEDWPSQRKDISYKEFLKIVKDTKIVILTGSAGIGKSILMQRLAFEFRSKEKKNNLKPNIDDYRIFFRKLNRQNLDGIFNDFEKIQESSRYTIFLDGLDELSELNNQSGSDLLQSLLKKLKEDISPKCNKIFISLRPEILDKGYSYKLPDEEDNISIFKIQNFNEKQIMAMYRNENRIHKDENNNKVIKATSKERRQNSQKLKLVIQNDPKNSVFTYPLILTWANEILSKRKVEELKYISWYAALGEVIDRELEREFDLYCKSNDIKKSDANYLHTKEEFMNDGKEFLLDVALNDMALFNTRQVTKENVSSNYLVKRVDKNQSNTVVNKFMRLLRYVDWSEKADNQPHYEFIHNTIYWRALAEALLNPNTPQNVRAQIILTQAKSNFPTPLMQYCRQGLWHKYGRKGFPYTDYISYMSTCVVGLKAVKCNAIGNDMPLEVILSCFYGFEEIDLDSSVRFGFSQIQEFVKDRKLNLSYTNITDLSILNYFGDNSFDFLECITSGIIKAVIPNYVKGINFCKCTSLTDITIPESVTCIEELAFGGCTSLKSINLHNGIMSIGVQAFGGCTSLKSITLPNGVTKLNNQVFQQCTSLVDITIPDGVTSIGIAAFQQCTSLSNIKMPDSVTSIGVGAFLGCTSLTEISLSAGITTIGESAFV